MSTLTIGQGKMQIEALLRKVAEVQGVKVAGVRWRQETSDPPLYYLEATSDTGRTDDMKFSPEHLAGCESDNKMKFQVRMKIEGLVIRLKKPIRRTRGGKTHMAGPLWIAPCLTTEHVSRPSKRKPSKTLKTGRRATFPPWRMGLYGGAPPDAARGGRGTAGGHVREGSDCGRASPSSPQYPTGLTYSRLQAIRIRMDTSSVLFDFSSCHRHRRSPSFHPVFSQGSLLGSPLLSVATTVMRGPPLFRITVSPFLKCGMSLAV